MVVAGNISAPGRLSTKTTQLGSNEVRLGVWVRNVISEDYTSRTKVYKIKGWGFNTFARKLPKWVFRTKGVEPPTPKLCTLLCVTYLNWKIKT